MQQCVTLAASNCQVQLTFEYAIVILSSRAASVHWIVVINITGANRRNFVLLGTNKPAMNRGPLRMKICISFRA